MSELRLQRVRTGYYRTLDGRWDISQGTAPDRDGWSIRSNNRIDAQWLREQELTQQSFRTRRSATQVLEAALYAGEPELNPEELEQIKARLMPLRREGERWLLNWSAFHIEPRAEHGKNSKRYKRREWRIQGSVWHLGMRVGASGVTSQIYRTREDAVDALARAILRADIPIPDHVGRAEA